MVDRGESFETGMLGKKLMKLVGKPDRHHRICLSVDQKHWPRKKRRQMGSWTPVRNDMGNEKKQHSADGRDPRDVPVGGEGRLKDQAAHLGMDGGRGGGGASQGLTKNDDAILPQIPSGEKIAERVAGISFDSVERRATGGAPVTGVIEAENVISRLNEEGNERKMRRHISRISMTVKHGSARNAGSPQEKPMEPVGPGREKNILKWHAFFGRRTQIVPTGVKEKAREKPLGCVEQG